MKKKQNKKEKTCGVSVGLAIDSELRNNMPPVSRCTVLTLRVTPVGANLDSYVSESTCFITPSSGGFHWDEVLISVGNQPSLCLL